MFRYAAPPVLEIPGGIEGLKDYIFALYQGGEMISDIIEHVLEVAPEYGIYLDLPDIEEIILEVIQPNLN